MRFPVAIALALAACGGDAPTKEESQQLLTAATTALSSARTRALSSVAATVDFRGPCAQGGSVAVEGSVEAESGHTAVDLRAAFDDCTEAQGTIDGDLHVISSVTGGSVAESIKGSISLVSPSLSASCDLDVTLNVDAGSVAYHGKVCGYEVEVHVGN